MLHSRLESDSICKNVSKRKKKIVFIKAFVFEKIQFEYLSSTLGYGWTYYSIFTCKKKLGLGNFRKYFGYIVLFILKVTVVVGKLCTCMYLRKEFIFVPVVSKELKFC